MIVSVPDLCLPLYIELSRGIIFQLIYVEIDKSDFDSPKHEKIKNFWSFVKSPRKTLLKMAHSENRILKTDTKDKVNTCHR